MKITVLVENRLSLQAASGLAAQYGLSLLIEAGEKTILIDTGCDDLFFRNAEVLGINLSSVDYVILSHGHYDHGGGLETFFKVNNHAPVYLHKAAFGDYYSTNRTKDPRYVGLDKSLQSRFGNRFKFVEGKQRIDDFCVLAADFGFGSPRPEGNKPLLKKTSGENFVEDDFIHEIAAMLYENGKSYLFSPCSHSGILNIIDRTGIPDYLFAGLHLNDRDKIDYGEDPVLQEVVNELDKKDICCYLAHCTGDKAFQFINSHSRSLINPFSTGDIFEF